MNITFGKHKGKSVGTIIIKDPDYVIWLLNQEVAKEPLKHTMKEVRRLIGIFDSKPFTCKCHTCDKTATRYSLAFPSPIPYWWCDKCGVRSGGCVGLMTVGANYEEALQYYVTAGLTKTNLRHLIRDLAGAKGLPNRVGEAQVAQFFGEKQ